MSMIDLLRGYGTGGAEEHSDGHDGANDVTSERSKRPKSTRRRCHQPSSFFISVPSHGLCWSFRSGFHQCCHFRHPLCPSLPVFFISFPLSLPPRPASRPSRPGCVQSSPGYGPGHGLTVFSSFRLPGCLASCRRMSTSNSPPPLPLSPLRGVAIRI